jgi:hypothetical protein
VLVRVLMPIGRLVGCAKGQVLGIYVGSTQSAVEQTAKGKSCCILPSFVSVLPIFNSGLTTARLQTSQ